jgi:mono/diheme cytochrome c family protein
MSVKTDAQAVIFGKCFFQIRCRSPEMNQTDVARSFLIHALIVVLLLVAPGLALGQQQPSDCVELGAAAFDDWTRAGAGGVGLLPTDVPDRDYVRCTACHGWDRRGMEGGYARRSRTASRPNAGAGDVDTSSRVITTGKVTADMILHSRTGRSYADGSASWVPLEPEHSAANKAAHSNGYTLGNQHPDFSPQGVNWQKGIPSDLQIGCLVEFLNFEGGDPAQYFAQIDATQEPVLYTIVDTADAASGEALFNDRCESCHTLNFVLGYLQGDGRFSELAHKARWGVPDSAMSRHAMGDPTEQDIADLLLYLQQQGGTGFALNPGLTGTWWNAAREGEGFMLEFGNSNDALTLFASFYTYDNMGNQAWLVASPTGGSLPESGTDAPVDLFLVTGPMWGDDFNPDDRNVMQWGTGTFSFPGCSSGSVTLKPGAEAQGMGYTELSYELTRDLLKSGIACPSAN